ncbi:MAG TPA: tRNA (N(6)-L-threonylcarbamoyladenosine(37)-C(2))-methylthiotransferase MtaB [Bdellovibrionales bacterium]|nr:tRNA (N(6)-L-threonylcarbamoyladenosine(37)-C(2))-methylthiotransferase MtaB [Bdellovibrionales bacterium]
MAYQIHTFGCKVNTYDTGLLQKRFEKTELGQNETRVHILNTCAVTAEATKEAVKLVRRLKARDPFCKVVVTGCAAQVDTGSFELPGADLVVGNSHKGQLEELIRKLLNGQLEGRVFRENIFRKLDLEEGGGVESDHSRSFLKIQDGCNSFCTYCVIPFARGRSRSIPAAYLAGRVNQLYSDGVREVVLTGVHIGDYECPATKTGLEGLMQTLLEKTTMPRFRLSSLEPVELSENMLDIYSGSGRFCPHFHMSIQSANTKVLADMKRKYTAEDVERALTRIEERVPGAFVGMDVIVGFPGETAEEFEDTYARLEKLPWSRIHVFPYSSRPGTKAAQFENAVPQNEIRERSKRLRMLSAERLHQQARLQIGSLKTVLGLKDGSALSRDYWAVRSNEPSWSPNTESRVAITGYRFESGERVWLEARPV